jgi:FAD/FMN-containing dehydrogenase
VRPGSVDEVAELVRWARRRRVALVPQGGNTGLVGGGVPLAGEVVVSLRRLDRVEAVDRDARQVTAGAGATIEAVQAAAAAAGLRYAVDFGARATATVGGSIATNAGGVNVVRHGGTREQVLGVEAVLGDGSVVRDLTGLVKDNTGYHLASLLCGSEGTLGIVTAARLRLVSLHAHRATALVAFATVADAVAAVGSWRSRIDDLDAIELVLGPGVELVCSAFDVRPPFASTWPAMVLVEASAHDDPVESLAAVVGDTPGVVDVAVAADDAGRRRLWRFREEHTLAIATLGVPYKFDVTVPISRLAEFVAEVPSRIAAVSPDVTTWQFGHAGDGNIHVNVTGCASSEQPEAAAEEHALEAAVYGYVTGLGGSISAEHGIGTAKAPWLHLHRSPAEISAMRAIKAALDPDSVLNPNVLLPPA